MIVGSMLHGMGWYGWPSHDNGLGYEAIYTCICMQNKNCKAII